MIKFVDSFVNRVTMYRLLLYYLAALLLVGTVFGALRIMPVDPLAVVETSAIFLVVAVISNWVMSRLLSIQANHESSIITALILSLIAGPVSIPAEPGKAGVLALAAVFAIVSKYLIAYRKQHVFNPAAFGIFLTGTLFGEYSTWWVGNIAMLPFVAIGGLLLLLRRISRFRFVGVFLAAFTVFQFGYSLMQGMQLGSILQNIGFIYLHTEVPFLAIVMLTEPLTSPKRFNLQIIYTMIVAFFLLPQLTFFGLNFSPEEALLLGNIFSFMVSPSFKLVLQLRDKRAIGRNILSFAFDRPSGFDHRLGQYMEWTLPLERIDSRGNRRYFSIASSPTENQLLIAARFYEHSSSYKESLSAMRNGDTIVAAELGGDFVLPNDPARKLAFIAGGIGITPFRSMVKFLLDKNQARDITLLYSNYGPDEIVFRDVFDEAQQKIGLTVVYTLTDPERVPADWTGKVGLVDEDMVRSVVPDFRERTFYVSGSPGLVDTVKRTLRGLRVPRSHIRSDYFPGYSS